MRSPWRLLLTGLLLLALPLKGWAGWEVPHCIDPSTTAGQVTVAMAVSVADPLEASGVVPVSQADHPCPGHGRTAATPNVKMKCSSCAPCCLGALPTATMELPTPPVMSQRVQEVPGPQAYTVTLAGLDRPPRSPRTSRA